MEAHSTTMNAEATSLLGTVGLAGGGMSESARATVSGDVDAYIGAQQSTASNGDQTRINISGSVAITAKSDAATAYADTIGGSGSVIIAVTLMSSTANITGSVLAYVGYLGSPSGPFRASFHAGSLDVAATATARDATATSNPVAVGLVGGGDGTNNPHQNSSTSAATVSGDVTAFLAPAGANPGSSPIFKLDVSGGDVTVNATSYSQALGELVGGSGGAGNHSHVPRGRCDPVAEHRCVRRRRRRAASAWCRRRGHGQLAEGDLVRAGLGKRPHRRRRKCLQQCHDLRRHFGLHRPGLEGVRDRRLRPGRAPARTPTPAPPS